MKVTHFSIEFKTFYILQAMFYYFDKLNLQMKFIKVVCFIFKVKSLIFIFRMKLLVVADDNDINNPRKGTAIIKIIVKDDNNHDPNININCLKSCVNSTST